MSLLLLGVLHVLALVWTKELSVSIECSLRPSAASLLALETVSGFNATAFYPLLSKMLKVHDNLSDCTAANVFEDALQYQFIDEASRRIVEQEFDLGAKLPFLEWMYSTADDTLGSNVTCDAVLWISGSYKCVDVSANLDFELELEKTGSEMPTIYPEDKVIGSGLHWVILYVKYESQFKDLHTQLIEMALEGQVVYVLRFMSAAPVRKHSLTGYVATMSLKNTDYSAINADNSTSLGIDNAPISLSESQARLLGYSTLETLSSVKNDTAKFELLQNISSRFVDYIPTITQHDGEKYRKSMESENPHKQMGINAVVINGKPVYPEDVFGFINLVEEEQALLQNLLNMLPKRTNAKSLLQSGISIQNSNTQNTRYNLTSIPRAIGWINDIEKQDEKYRELIPDYSVISISKGPFFPLKRNLYTLVIASKTLDSQTIETIKNALQLRIPIQVGFVSTNKKWLEISQLGLESRENFLHALALGYSVEDAAKVAYRFNEQVYSGEKVFKPLVNVKKWLKAFDLTNITGPAVFINGVYTDPASWKDKLPLVCAKDAQYLKSIDAIKLESKRHPRSLLFDLGKSTRVDFLDPLIPYPLSGWPLSFVKTEVQNVHAIHHVLLESNLASKESLDALETLALRGIDVKDIELTVVPLHGIQEKVYNQLMDESSTTFESMHDFAKQIKMGNTEKFSSKTPEVDPSSLPFKPDTIYVDGLKIVIKPGHNANYLNPLINRQTERVEKIDKAAPAISGMALSYLATALEDRVTLRTDVSSWDIVLKSTKQSSDVIFIINPASTLGRSYTFYAKMAYDMGMNIKIMFSASELDFSDVSKQNLLPAFNSNLSKPTFDLANHENALFSVDLDLPMSWYVLPTQVSNNTDLENVYLNGVSATSVDSVFEIKGLLLTGFVIGADSLELEAYTSNGTLVDQTVTINEGYFQLQVPKPGNYLICTPHEGFFQDFTSNEEGNDCIRISVSNYSPLSIRAQYIPLSPKTVLLPADSRTKKATDLRPHAQVNIFTIASGHLYERLASIMMLSVMKHTSRNVKFWLIEDFMSPKFRDFIPVMAKNFGFEYEFVNYKWPLWLRSQSDKQREIWAYKVLFLDVLFPTDLTDIIFVDSDQIVRTDFQDLLQIDMNDAPYALAPMGEGNSDLSQYMFWKKDYWKNKLGDKGLKYHISALYRVNLVKFRELGAGNIIRSRYQLLSSDPGSLANLDQDLLNDLQTILPIYTLDDEWLWCETWCDPDGFSEARTIDLCNNPLTKEPKLERAKRLIPEWTVYDKIVGDLMANKTVSAEHSYSPSHTDKEEDEENDEELFDAGDLLEALFSFGFDMAENDEPEADHEEL